jgi:hypothetical protein
MAIDASRLGLWIYASTLVVRYYRLFVAMHTVEHTDINRDVLTLS